MGEFYDDNYKYNSSKSLSCLRCGNLLENPSFEAGLIGWVVNNVSAAGAIPFEGAAAARMGQPLSSMFQDVLLEKTCKGPLLLSFEIYPNVSIEVGAVGNLIIEVLWIDNEGNIIGIGLRTLIPEERTTNTGNRLTFVEVTDTPPDNAVKARLQFTKGERANNTSNILDIDNVILAPIGSINLLKNSGFQLGLRNWNFTNASVQFINIYEGTARINLGPNGILTQNVLINKLPYNSNFLLSFAVNTIGEDNYPGGTFLKAQVIWLNRFGNAIGTGLDLSIDGDGISGQFNYTTYVDATSSAPDNAVAAEIKFINTDPNFTLRFDKVIFARVGSRNLLINPSFENAGGISPWIAEGTAVIQQTTDAYEGAAIARIPAAGGSLSQTVSVKMNKCYFLNFGYEIVGASSGDAGNLLAEVYWLDNDGKEIGLGLSIIVPRDLRILPLRWITYLGVTEPAPENAVKARIQFSKSAGVNAVDIDKVVFARLV